MGNDVISEFCNLPENVGQTEQSYNVLVWQATGFEIFVKFRLRFWVPGNA